MNLRPRLFLAAALPLAALLACAPPKAPADKPADALPKNHQPVAKHTQDSGGVMPPEQAALDFRHADLSFRVDPAGERIDATAILTLGIKAAVPVILIDLDPELAITPVKLNGAAAPFADPDGRLRITPPAPLTAGSEVKVEIAYGGQPHVAKRAPWDDGFVWAKTDKGQPWVASAVEGMGCDLFWPCIDHPLAKPGVVDQHVTVGPGMSAASNGILLGIRDAGNGWRTFDWRVKRPDTYAVAINVAPYEVLKSSYKSRFGNVIPMEFWHLVGHRAQAEALLKTVPDMIAFNEAKIGPYPFGDEKIGMVETPHLGMEHQTINAYGNGYPAEQWGYDSLLQHEFGHEWFGNQMSNKDWSDMWLHEGFTQFLQPLYSQHLKGDADYYAWLKKDRLLIGNKGAVAQRRPMTGEQVYVTDARGGPGQDIYYKGEHTLATLRAMIGDRLFFRTLTELVYGRPDPKPGNFQPRWADTDEYVAIVNRVTGRDLTWFFNAYLRTAALPDLIQTREGDRLKLTWKTGDGGPFPMPLEVSVNDKITTLPMKDGSGVVTAPEGAMVTIDPHSKILRRDLAIEAYQAYRKANPKGPPKPPAQDFKVTGYPEEKPKA
ncbi:M1 family metallopeptidase [soil metagenome]